MYDKNKNYGASGYSGFDDLTSGQYSLGKYSNIGKSGFDVGDIFTKKSMFGGKEVGPNGSILSSNGWVAPAANIAFGLLDYFNTKDALKEQQQQFNKMYGLKKDSAFANLAMQLSKYRDFRNNKSLAEAQKRLYDTTGQSYLSAADRDKYLQDRAVVDANGNKVADPINLSAFGSGNVGSTGSAFVRSGPNSNIGGATWDAVNGVSVTGPSVGPSVANASQFASPTVVMAQNEANAATPPRPKGEKKIKRKAGLSAANPKPMPNQKENPPKVG